MSDLTFDLDSMVQFLVDLLRTPSPTGYHREAMDVVEQAFRGLEIDDLAIARNPKGALILTWPGEQVDRPRGLTAHTDTLGLMVKEVKPNGRLKLTMLVGYMWNAVEFEAVTVQTFDGQLYRGTVVPVKASVHVHSDARDAPPFVVVHGSHDGVVPAWTARRFVEGVRQRSREPVVYAELPGARHAFDALHSLRTEAVIEAVELFAAWARSRRGRGAARPQAARASVR